MVKCPVPPKQTPPAQPANPSPIKAKVLQFYDGLRKIGGVISDGAQIEAELSKAYTVLVTSVAEIPLLNKYNKLESLLSSYLGIRSYFWQAASLGRTEAGKVSDFLQQRTREAVQMVELLATHKSLPTVRKLYDELKVSTGGSLEISELQELLHDHIVIGQFPRLTNIYDSPVVKAELNARYQKHVNRLMDLGLSPTSLGTLDELAGEISGYYDSARILVGKYGLDIKQLQNGGYFPLQANDIIKRFLDKEGETLFTNAGAAQYKSAGTLNYSRGLYVPVVLDLQKAADRLGLSELELTFMIGEPGQLSEYLYSKFSLEDIDLLFENGTLAQLPVLSDEITNFFNKSLELPIENMGQAIWADPVKAMERYNAQLKSAVENAALMQASLEEGVKYGWVLDNLEYESLLQADKNNFVKIGSSKLMQELFRGNTLREAIADSWIHKTVADQLKAHFVVNTSFEKLGIIGSGLKAFLRVTGDFKRGVLTAAGEAYLKRVFVQNMVSLQAGGGADALANYASASAQMVNFHAKKTMDVFSDVKKFSVGGKDISERDLFFTMFVRSGGDFASVAGERVLKSEAWTKLREKLNPDSLRKFWEMTKIYNQRYGSPFTGQVLDTAGLIAEMTDDTWRGAYELLAQGNQLADFSARWALLKAVVNNPSAAGRDSWKNLDEVIRYTNEYMGINENSGIVGKAASQFIVPFASFSLVAPGSALRHAIRHPWRYARMMSLYIQAQQSANQGLTDAEVDQWREDGFPLFVGRDSEGRPISINPGTVDFYLDTTSWVKENFEKASRLSGVEAGSTTEILDSKINRTSDISKSVYEFFNKSYLSRPILAAVVGIDPQTLEPISELDKDTVLNVEMPRRWSRAITDSLPALRALDRSLPPSIVGAAPQTDVLGVEKSPAVAGWLGNVPSTGGSRPRLTGDLSKPEEMTAWILNSGGGLTLSQLDPEKQLVKTYRDFDKRITDINGVLAKLDDALLQQTRPDRAKLEEQRLRLQQLKGSLEFQKIVTRFVAQKKGYADPQAVEQVRQTIRGLQDVPQEALLEYLRTRE